MTGPRGFIGRHLVARLKREGLDVLEWGSDIRRVAECATPAEVVFHLAAVTRHERFAEAPHESYDINVTGTCAVLEYCRRMHACCIMASTSGVYSGSGEGRALSEDAPVGPTSPYGISKWLGENLCRQASRSSGVPSVVLRLFNVYGPGQEPAYLVPYILECVVRREPIRLRMPDAVRDFVYVDDVVEAFIRAASFCRLLGPGRGDDPFEVFNIGSGVPTRVRDVLTDLVELCGAPPTHAHGDARQGEAARVTADCRRAREVLGWRAEVPLKE
ncbi:MAG: NAD-dependent epimerase/dehydratase family protein, partial [Deltaproteobacteria bacterium]|nr:NAD-dependent epimerase/dehydratase family protein [Deltaproteobacteria bacterium]